MLTNICFIKIRSKHNSNTLLNLLRIFMKQTLCLQTVIRKQTISSCCQTIFKHVILKKFSCHFEKFQKDETQCQWVNKERNRSKRKKMYLTLYASRSSSVVPHFGRASINGTKSLRSGWNFILLGARNFIKNDPE